MKAPPFGGAFLSEYAKAGAVYRSGLCVLKTR